MNNNNEISYYITIFTRILNFIIIQIFNTFRWLPDRSNWLLFITTTTPRLHGRRICRLIEISDDTTINNITYEYIKSLLF